MLHPIKTRSSNVDAAFIITYEFLIHLHKKWQWKCTCKFLPKYKGRQRRDWQTHWYFKMRDLTWVAQMWQEIVNLNIKLKVSFCFPLHCSNISSLYSWVHNAHDLLLMNPIITGIFEIIIFSHGHFFFSLLPTRCACNLALVNVATHQCMAPLISFKYSVIHQRLVTHITYQLNVHSPGEPPHNNASTILQQNYIIRAEILYQI